MRVLLTGATGFIGTRLARRLASSPSVAVTGTGRSASPGEELRGVLTAYRPADLSSPDECARLADRIDAIVHCAGKSGIWGSYTSYFEANVIPTRI